MSKYTFLLPAYKGRFLGEMLNSIKNQTYTDFKVIISDDCSPEDLKSISSSYLSDSRFTYRRNLENMGGKSLVSHWSLLVDMCDTDYFIMASDDDLYEPNFLEEIDRLVIKYPQVDLFRAKVKVIDKASNLMICDSLLDEYIDHSHFFYQYYTNMLTCEANYVYKTSSFKQKGGYVDFPLAWFTDDATHIVMAGNGCVNTSEILFSYRNSPLAISSKWGDSKDAALKVEASLKYWKWINDYITNIPQSKERNLLGLARRKCKDKVLLNINTSIQFLSMRDFFKYNKLCKAEMGMSRFLLWHHWSRYYFHNHHS